MEALLSSGLEVKPEQGDKQEGKSLSLQFGDFSEVTPCTVVKTPELEAYLEVPWEVPKLRKKLQSRKKIPPQEFMQGSDSGISMSSQETREVAPWLQPPKLRRRLELEGGGCSQAPAARVERQQRAGSGSEGESRRSLCLSQPSSSSVAANAEFLVQSYPGPRPASMVSASLGLGCRSATEGGGEGAAEEVKLGEDRLEEGETVGNGESFQPPPDISDLPFSMPKLARRLGQAPSSPPLKLFRQPASQSLSLNISPPDLGSCVSQPCSPTFPGAKPLKSRPMSLVQPNNQAGPQLNLPLHSRPGEKTSLPDIFKLHVFFKVFFLWQEVPLGPLVALIHLWIPWPPLPCSPTMLPVFLAALLRLLLFRPERSRCFSLRHQGTVDHLFRSIHCGRKKRQALAD